MQNGVVFVLALIGLAGVIYAIVDLSTNHFSKSNNATKSMKTRKTYTLFAEMIDGFEYRWLFQVALSDVKGVALDLKDREEFVDFVPKGDVIFICIGHPSQDELQVISTRYANHKLIFFQLSDEENDYDAAFYPKCHLVYRNYFHVVKSLDIQCEYLLRKKPTWNPERNVFWYPLGYGKFIPSLSLVLPISERSHLWSFVGSHKPQRDMMVNSINNARNSEELIAKASIFKYFETFGESQMATPLRYSQTLYNSKFIPCPRGGSAEQFRIWECFEAGCIPIIDKTDLDEHIDLQYMKLLNLKQHIIPVESWDHFDQLLTQLEIQVENNPKHFDKHQLHMMEDYQQIKRNFQTHVAHVLQEKFVASVLRTDS